MKIYSTGFVLVAVTLGVFLFSPLVQGADSFAELKAKAEKGDAKAQDNLGVLYAIIETSRRYEIDTLFVSRQPNLIHGRVRNQVTAVISFSQIDANTMTMLEDLKFSPEEQVELQVGDSIARRFSDDLTQRGNIFKDPKPSSADVQP